MLFTVGCKREAAAPAQASAVAPPVAAEPTAPPPPANQVASTVADLPDYPGATRVKLETESKTGFAHVTQAKFVTTDQFDKVKAFYEQAIAANGWQIVSTSQKPGEAKWGLAKGTSLGEIDLDTEKTGGVSIKLERKDR